MTQRFVYLGAGSERFLATLHQPPGPPQPTSVLVLPPFGWEEESSYRARRAWADDLSRHGYPALRLDLPGTGDSAGTADDQGLWAIWNNAVAVAAGWLRTENRSQSLTAIGIGLGGLLAHQAAARGDVDDLVLWATASTGRRVLREIRAFSVHESARIAAAGGQAPPPLPPGSLAPGGFFISPETVHDLDDLDLARHRLPASAHVLFLDRDGLKPDPALVAEATLAQAQLTFDPGRGYGAMLTDPDQSRPPLDVFETTRKWLAQRTPPDPLGESASGARESGSAGELKMSGLRERPLTLQHPNGALVGVLTTPTERANAPLTAVFLNAGAIRRIGPHRMWVETARRWALQGVASLRIDLEGIGDSDGEGRRFSDVANFYDDRFITQTRDALDALERAGCSDRFLLVGLCSGGYWAFQTSLADRRVVSTLMLNPRVLHWNDRVEVLRTVRKLPLLAQPATWKRLIRGNVSAARCKQAISALLRAAHPGQRAADPESAHSALIAASFDQLQANGVHTRFVFCEGEPQYDELERYGYLTEQLRWPNISYSRIPGRDHTLRPLWMHRHVNAELDGALAAELALAPDAARKAQPTFEEGSGSCIDSDDAHLGSNSVLHPD